MSNPGLTPEWASITLDSHQKGFADECAICFSEIGHDFRVADLAVKADDYDDVASAGTVESEDYASCAGRPATFLAQPCDGAAAKGACSQDLPSSLQEAAAAEAEDIVQAGAMSSGAESPACGSPVNEAADLRKQAPAGLPPPAAAFASELRTEVAPDARDGGAAAVRLDDGRHPDAIAEELLKQPAHMCSREQLDFLYKTCRCVHPHRVRVRCPCCYCGGARVRGAVCRYREEAMRRGVAYASCGHAFHPICLLEYEKHAGQRAGNDSAIKCPLCRQPYTVKHFIPDENLRSLCL